MTMSRPIPAEITDHIISLVEVRHHGEMRTLCNCSLVCRAWLPKSRTRLFDQIYFSDQHNYNNFNTTILRNASMQPWLTHVHEITVRAPGSEDEIPSPADPHEEKWSQRFMHEIAGRLPNLKAMYLRGFDWVHLPPHPTICTTFSTFRNLRVIDLRYCCLPSFSILHGIIVALPSLKELELREVKCPPAPREVIFISRRAYPTLTALTILFPCEKTKHSIDNLLHWLGTTPTTQSIRNISFLTHGTKPWIDSQVEFMYKISHSVTSLSRPHLTTDLPRIPVGELVNLEILAIQFSTKDTWADLVLTLQQLRGQRLRELQLYTIPRTYMHPSNRRQDACIDISGLEAVDRVLEGLNLKLLTVVDFRVEAAIVWEEYFDAMNARLLSSLHSNLPKLLARGIIKLDYDWYYPP